MHDTTTADSYVPSATLAMNNLILSATGRATGSPITSGLPAGSVYADRQRLIVGGTPMMLPIFQPAMRRVAQDARTDVIVSRHGFYPEALGPVLWDVCYWLNNTVASVSDYILCESRHGEFWLVPPKSGPHLRLASDGIHVEVVPDFVSWDERNFGVCQAAKRIRAAATGGWR